jgi:hypothetical protein
MLIRRAQLFLVSTTFDYTNFVVTEKSRSVLESLFSFYII